VTPSDNDTLNGATFSFTPLTSILADIIHFGSLLFGLWAVYATWRVLRGGRSTIDTGDTTSTEGADGARSPRVRQRPHRTQTQPIFSFAALHPLPDRLLDMGGYEVCFAGCRAEEQMSLADCLAGQAASPRKRERIRAFPHGSSVRER
jgi:hypothetical protein